jgi:cytochrome o ubiquinol oxidase subunit 2
VLALTVLIAWRYRHSNKAAPYEPDWDHSTRLELVIWGAPLLIIICLGAMTWMATHLLDPYRPLSRIAPGQAVMRDAHPLEVEVVALDWKWLFIYPQYGIATVNEMAAPVDREIEFHITSATVMNSFYIPALAGQIYAMAGMQTTLHAVMNQPGTYRGISANYSGAGFSGMHFAFHSLPGADFDKWVAAAKAGGGNLDRATYLALAHPSENDPVRTYGTVDGKLYDAILTLCVEPGPSCMNMNKMTATDPKGGHMLAGATHTMSMGSELRSQAATGNAEAAMNGMPGMVSPKAAAPILGAGMPSPSPVAPLQGASSSTQSAPAAPSKS